MSDPSTASTTTSFPPAVPATSGAPAAPVSRTAARVAQSVAASGIASVGKATAPTGAQVAFAAQAPAAPVPPSAPSPVLALDYADRSLRRRRFRWWWGFAAVRRLMFAAGVGLFCAGAAQGMWRDDTSFVAVGWGATLVALVIPFPALSRRPRLERLEPTESTG